jgi:hypothetical protein
MNSISLIPCIGKTVELNEVEQRLTKHIAKQRYLNNRDNNVTNARIGDQTDIETDRNGFGAEMAFCKLFNVFPDLSIFTRTASEDNGDAILHIQKTVDVKTTKYPNGKLLAVTWKEHNVDLYALMIGEFPKYTFRGFMDTHELLKPSRIGSLGYGETYIASQDELKELSEIYTGDTDGR